MGPRCWRVWESAPGVTWTRQRPAVEDRFDETNGECGGFL